MEELRLQREKSRPKTPSTDSFWDSSSLSDEIAQKKTKPEYNLSKRCDLARIQSIAIKGTPQTVCRNTNENLDLTYVTDLEHNKIWMFAGFVHKGTSQFLTGRDAILSFLTFFCYQRNGPRTSRFTLHATFFPFPPER